MVYNAHHAAGEKAGRTLKTRGKPALSCSRSIGGKNPPKPLKKAGYLGATASKAVRSPPEISASWARIISIGQFHQAKTERRAATSGESLLRTTRAGLTATIV